MSTRDFSRIVGVLLAGALALACGGDPNALGAGGDDPLPPGAATDPAATPPGTPAVLSCTEKPQGRSYKGYGNVTLEIDRVDEASGENRARVKPYGVLAGEYTRTLGAAPASLAANASTFGAVADRWYEEAHSDAVELTTTSRIAFEGCLKFTATAPEFAAAPTDATAKAECSSMMRTFWSHTPQPGEIAPCATFATTALASEPDPRRRWAYVCSAVMTSTRFLTF